MAADEEETSLSSSSRVNVMKRSEFRKLRTDQQADELFSILYDVVPLTAKLAEDLGALTKRVGGIEDTLARSIVSKDSSHPRVIQVEALFPPPT